MARAFVQWLGQQVFDYALGAEMDEEMNEEEETIDLQCGRTLFQDVPARMRTELWMSQLHANPSALRAAHNYEAYLRLVRSQRRARVAQASGDRVCLGDPRARAARTQIGTRRRRDKPRKRERKGEGKGRGQERGETTRSVEKESGRIWSLSVQADARAHARMQRRVLALAVRRQPFG